MGKKYREKEGQEEMIATVEVGLTSFNDILEFNSIQLTYPSYEQKKDRKGTTTQLANVECRGQDINKKTTWEKFIEIRGYNDKDLISLSNGTARLTEEFYLFMINDYTDAFKTGSDRYHNLDLDGKTWLRKVCRLAVKDHIMKNKLVGEIQSGIDDEDDKDYFHSELAFGRYMLIRWGVKAWLDNTVRCVQKIVKEPDNRDYIIQEIVKGIGKELREWSSPQRETILRILKEKDNEETQGNNNSQVVAL